MAFVALIYSIMDQSKFSRCLVGLLRNQTGHLDSNARVLQVRRVQYTDEVVFPCSGGVIHTELRTRLHCEYYND